MRVPSTDSLLDSAEGWSGCPGCAGSRGRAAPGSRESDRRTCRAARALRCSVTPASTAGRGARLHDGSERWRRMKRILLLHATCSGFLFRVPSPFTKSNSKTFQAFWRRLFELFQHLKAVENYIFIYSTHCTCNIQIILLLYHIKLDVIVYQNRHVCK